jgi:hypothetical protein
MVISLGRLITLRYDDAKKSRLGGKLPSALVIYRCLRGLDELRQITFRPIADRAPSRSNIKWDYLAPSLGTCISSILAILNFAILFVSITLILRRQYCSGFLLFLHRFNANITTCYPEPACHTSCCCSLTVTCYHDILLHHYFYWINGYYFMPIPTAERGSLVWLCCYQLRRRFSPCSGLPCFRRDFLPILGFQAMVSAPVR